MTGIFLIPFETAGYDRWQWRSLAMLKMPVVKGGSPRREIMTKLIRHKTIFNFHMNNSETITENIQLSKIKLLLLKLLN